MIVIVQDDPFDTAYLRDTLAAIAPDSPLLAFDTLPEALHALAGYSAGAANARRPVILMLEAALLTDGPVSGSEALQRQRALAPLRVVALVGSDDVADARRAVAAGGDDVIRKPADPMILCRVLGVAWPVFAPAVA